MTASNLKFDHDVLLGGCFNGGRLYGHWQVPDTVVINLGANDFGISPPSFATFSSALNNLLDRVQAMAHGARTVMATISTRLLRSEVPVIPA